MPTFNPLHGRTVSGNVDFEGNLKVWRMNEIVELKIKLDILRKAFDKEMIEGSTIDKVRSFYASIRAIERRLVRWETSRGISNWGLCAIRKRSNFPNAILQLKTLYNQLVDLKFAFDHAMMNGNSFADVKKIYVQIKEVEKLITQREGPLLEEGRDKSQVIKKNRGKKIHYNRRSYSDSPLGAR